MSYQSDFSDAMSVYTSGEAVRKIVESTSNSVHTASTASNSSNEIGYKLPFLSRLRQYKRKATPSPSKPTIPQVPSVETPTTSVIPLDAITIISSQMSFDSMISPLPPRSFEDCVQSVRGDQSVDVGTNATATETRVDQTAEIIRFQQQRYFWRNIVLKRSVQLGPNHLKTAEGLMHLGNAQMSCKVCAFTPLFLSIHRCENLCITFQRSVGLSVLL
jgi:hypothetical protein